MKTDLSRKKQKKQNKTRKKKLDGDSALTGFAAEHIAVVKFSWQTSMGTLPVILGGTSLGRSY